MADGGDPFVNGALGVGRERDGRTFSSGEGQWNIAPGEPSYSPAAYSRFGRTIVSVRTLKKWNWAWKVKFIEKTRLCGHFTATR